jgi:hypothetical protein
MCGRPPGSLRATRACSAYRLWARITAARENPQIQRIVIAAAMLGVEKWAREIETELSSRLITPAQQRDLAPSSAASKTLTQHADPISGDPRRRCPHPHMGAAQQVRKLAQAVRHDRTDSTVTTVDRRVPLCHIRDSSHQLLVPSPVPPGASCR